jgi:uncharacterized membrane protein
MPTTDATLPEVQLEALDTLHTLTTDPDGRRLLVAERGVWSLVWLAFLITGTSVWGFSYRSTVVVIIAVVMVSVGMVGLVSCWTVKSPRSPWFQIASLLSVVVAMIFPAAIRINVREFYSTDSAAFEQAAAHALQHGGDPYVVSMSSAATYLHVAARFWTYTVNGGHVSHYSYPAGSFLFETLAMMLGFHHMVVDWVDLIAWLVTVVILFALLPSSLRWLAALLGLTPFLLGGFSSGETDALFLPFLVLAAWRWDRFGQDRQAGLARWMGPIALGLACSIKQTPWFCVPLLASGIYLEARQAGRPAGRLLLRYLSTVLGVFAVVNLPFVIWSPSAWLHGTLLPLDGGLIADGQGLVVLATQGVTGGVNLTLLSIAAALALVAVVIAFIVWYARLKPLCLLLVPIPFFFSPRSLSSYLVDVIPAALIAGLSVRPSSGHASLLSAQRSGLRMRTSLALGMALSSVGVVVACTLAFVGPPLALSVRSITKSHDGKMLDAVTVSVHNRTAAKVTPRFMVNTGGDPSGFWKLPHHKTLILGPHDSAVVTLYSPESTNLPKAHSRWTMNAYTQGPSWLSTSPLRTSP